MGRASALHLAGDHPSRLPRSAMKTQPPFRNFIVRFVISLLLVLTALGPWAAAQRTARAAGPYVVTTAADGNDDVPNNGICAISGGGCSLRAAIEEAFNDG